MIDTIVDYIPVVMVVLCVVSGLIAHLKYKRKLEERDGYCAHLCWSFATCVMGILVLYLVSRGVSEEGFIDPIIMGLVFMGFFWFMSVRPIMSFSKE